MITLVASTVTLLISKKNIDRYIRITSDSITPTRIAYTPDILEMAQGGFSFSLADNIVVYLPANEQIYAISTGTPNLGLATTKIIDVAITLMT